MWNKAKFGKYYIRTMKHYHRNMQMLKTSHRCDQNNEGIYTEHIMDVIYHEYQNDSAK